MPPPITVTIETQPVINATTIATSRVDRVDKSAAIEPDTKLMVAENATMQITAKAANTKSPLTTAPIDCFCESLGMFPSKEPIR